MSVADPAAATTPAGHGSVAARAAAPADPPARGWRAWRPAYTGAGLAALLLGSLVALMHFGRGGGFYYDDWNFVLFRRGWNADALLLPHNEHLSLVPVVIYKLLFATVGLDSYWVFRLTLALVHAGTLAALFAYARPRVGPVLALLAPAAIAVLGAAYIDLLWAFQLGYAVSLLTGVLAFVVLDRRGVRADAAACALACLSLASSSVGLCVLAGLGVEILARRRRSWWMLVVPVVGYAAWYLGYHQAGAPITLDNILAITQFGAQGLAGTFGAITGLNLEWGRSIALAAVALGLWWSIRTADGVPWRLLALLAMPLSFWALASAARASQVGAETGRYLYPTAVFVLLVGVEATRGVRLRTPTLAVLAGLLVLASLTNLAQLRSGGRELALFSDETSGLLGALEVAGDRIPSEYTPGPTLSPQITAGPYRVAVADYGPVLGGEAAVVRSSPTARSFADAAMQQGLGFALAPSAGAAAGPAPAVEVVESATSTKTASCVRLLPQGAGGAVTLPLPAAGVVVASGADTSVTLRLWADGFANPALVTGATRPVLLRAPDDGAQATWRARIAFGKPTRVCGVG